MSIFREYDIRGIYQKDLSQEVVCKIGFLLGQRINKYDDKVALGYDARTHSPMLFKWLSSGLLSSGVQVFDLGLIPTPVAYFSTYKSGINSSIMITGSHNPPQYNGFKITINRSPFYGADIQDLALQMQNVSLDSINLKHDIKTIKLDMLEEYIRFISNEFRFLTCGEKRDSKSSGEMEVELRSKNKNIESSLSKHKQDAGCMESNPAFQELCPKPYDSPKGFRYKIAIDCGNGVAGVALEKILQNLGLDSKNLYFTPDGTFPNHHPDPSEIENLRDLQNVMQNEDIPIGIAFDGDADRVALLSQNHVFKGDELAILFAKDMARSIKNLIVLGEVKCSAVMYESINRFGRAMMYKTGHSNLKMKLKELGAHLACEMSGHIFFNDRYFGYDDGIYAAFRILELIFKSENGIGDLESAINALPRTYSTDEEKIAVSEEAKFEVIKRLKERLLEIAREFTMEFTGEFAGELQGLECNQKRVELRSKNKNIESNDIDSKDSQVLSSTHKLTNENTPKIKEIIDIDGVRVIFENGWGLIRASNTTPMLVTRFEAYSKKDLEIYKDFLLGLLSE